MSLISRLNVTIFILILVAAGLYLDSELENIWKEDASNVPGGKQGFRWDGDNDVAKDDGAKETFRSSGTANSNDEAIAKTLNPTNRRSKPDVVETLGPKGSDVVERLGPKGSDSAPLDQGLGTSVPTASTTTFQTTLPTTDAKEKEKCLKLNLISTRKDYVWNCSTTVDVLSEHEPVESLHADENDLSDVFTMSRTAIWIKGGRWGQLCNMINIIAGYFFERESLGLSHTLAAFSTEASEIIWTFNLDLFSNAARGILLDCVDCGSSMIRCHRGLYKGRLFDLSDKVFTYETAFEVGNLFYGRTPRRRGNLPALVKYIRPKKHLTAIIEKLVEKIRLTMSRQNELLVAMHRRYMDNMCYRYMSSHIEYQCNPQDVNYRRIQKHAADFRDFQSEHKAEIAASDYWRKLSPLLISQMEERVPLVLTCNYSFTSDQVKVINKTWPIVTQSNLTLLVADDKATPLGRASLQASGMFREIFDVQMMENPECFATKKYHFMLAEMLGMVLADHHMGCATSSCDAIVAIWRNSTGKPLGSSYPRECYDGFFRFP